MRVGALWNGLDRDLQLALVKANGFELESGVRVLGTGAETPDFSLEEWNAPDGWRFAWTEFLPSDAVVFAYDIVGACFFYRPGERGVHHLDFDGAHYPVAETPGQYLAFAATHQREGVALALRAHAAPEPRVVLAPIPPQVLGGKLDGTLVHMRADLALVAAGDLATEVAAGTRAGRTVAAGLEPYVDEAGRKRLRIEWLR
ncbi:MAG: hypothetical protein JNL79_09830 [Myxococcales bacterium]|nr:hypothetical protein [Myxococcales bacterium]